MRSVAIAALMAVTFAGGAARAQAPELQVDLMQLADADGDGKVTLEEYQKFSESGWEYISGGADKVKVANLEQSAQMAFVGIMPDKDGYVTRKMYLDAVPARFKMLDTNKDGWLSADEINGKTQQQ